MYLKVIIELQEKIYAPQDLYLPTISCKEATPSAKKLKPMLVQNGRSDDREVGTGVQHAGRESLEHPIDDGYLNMALV